MAKASRNYANSLLNFINESPTPFQSVENLAAMLDKAGAVRIEEGDKWEVKAGVLYYFIKSGTQIASFRLGKDPVKYGFRIAAAHHDTPGFRIKSVPSKTDMGYERIYLEGYGGLIVHGWLDRPLSVAGRVYYRDEKGNAAYKNINIHKPLLVIPSAAIHVVRDVNNGAKFNLQTEMLPFFAQREGNETGFLAYIAKEVGCKAEDILSYELAPYEYAPGCFVGENEEFMSVPRLDDAAMAHAVISGMCDKGGYTDIGVVFDHEEIGSNSDRGAKSDTIAMVVDRICEALGYTSEEKYRALSKTIVFSADMAHATHPSYAGLSDPNLVVKLNKGPVLKLAYRQSYSTSAEGSAFFMTLCEKEKIPYQIFNNRSDNNGGGTIGPIISSMMGVVTVDIGNPQLSMHSVRELGGVEDGYYMVRLFKAFFRG